MLSGSEFIRQSLGLHLFFARIMKEHSFFLEIGFTPKNSNLAQQADNFKTQFDGLLSDATALSNGVVNPDILRSGEVVTPYTLKAETVTQYFSGVHIQIGITQAETGLSANAAFPLNHIIEQRVIILNNRAISLISGLIQFKTVILSDVLSCKMFTVNYPLLIDHILREAKLYLGMVQKLQRREKIESERQAMEQESFWNRIMAEHAKFIRGLLDPTENELIQAANNFGNEFDSLTAEAKAAMDATMPTKKVTGNSLKATLKIRNFKEQGTQGILSCKIKSVIIPLLGDHVLREANHYLRLLKKFEKKGV